MSHLKERKDRNCLNCNAQLQGKFCHICGQENIEAKETVWHLVSHFFQDITHFDGKFFSTLKFLLLRPGFLSREYMAGRRASYLNPIRMYVFTSAFFFLVFFNLFKANEGALKINTNINGKTLPEIAKMDSSTFADFTREINRNNHNPDVPMSRNEFEYYQDTSFRRSGLHFTNAVYKTRAAYDSVLSLGIKKHYWWQKQLIYKEIELNKKYNNNTVAILNAFKSSLLHSLPQMLFISLPLLALLLKLLYARRKEFYYVSHAIFSVHLYIFIFIAMLILFSLNKLNDQLHWGGLTFVVAMMSFGLFFYMYKAMRNFYGQGRGKTILKFILLHLMNFVVIMLLFVIFIFLSMFNI